MDGDVRRNGHRLTQLAATDEHSLFVVGGWSGLTVGLVLGLLVVRRRPFVIWTDTPALTARRNPLKARLRSGWLWVLFRNASIVMGTGGPALQALLTMGCQQEKLVNFPYFIDINAWVPRAARPYTQELRFLSSGRLAPEKGYDIALEALSIAYQNSQRSFRYQLIGSGPELARLQQRAADLGIQRNVEFLGWLQPAEMQIRYSESDVFLHPARYEPFGVAVAEAMASGLLVIGSDATMAALDRICSGVNGLVHRSGDPRDLAKHISYLVEHPDCIDSMKNAARKTAEQWPVARAVDMVKRLASALL